MIPNWASGPQNHPNANVAVCKFAGTVKSIGGTGPTVFSLAFSTFVELALFVSIINLLITRPLIEKGTETEFIDCCLLIRCRTGVVCLE